MRTLRFLPIVAGAVLLSGCWHRTQLAATWRDPAASPTHFQHPIAIFVSKSETFRRTMEDKMAAQFVNGVPSYRILASTDVADGAAIRQQLATAGYDAAIIMRVADVDSRIVSYTTGRYWSGAPYYSFAGYWGSAWGYPYDPGYVDQETIVSIETQLYSLTSDKLVWAARSETTDPSSVGKLGDSVLRHVMKELQKERLVGV
jgi:hypothetical protein